jgi:hypothetical protein
VRSAEAVHHIRVTLKNSHCNGKKRPRRMANAAPSDAATYKGLLSTARELYCGQRRAEISLRSSTMVSILKKRDVFSIFSKLLLTLKNLKR